MYRGDKGRLPGDSGSKSGSNPGNGKEGEMVCEAGGEFDEICGTAVVRILINGLKANL